MKIKMKLAVCILSSIFAVSANAGMLNKNSLDSQNVVNIKSEKKEFTANIKIYEQDMSLENTLSKINSTGVYNENNLVVNNLNDKDYKLISITKMGGYEGLPLPYSNYKEIPIVKSIKTDTDDKGNSSTTVIPGSIKEGYDLYLNKLGNKLTVKITDKVVKDIKILKANGKELSLPQRDIWSISQTYYIEKDKVIRIDSPSYIKYTEGKEKSFKHIYIIKLQEK